jgi:hypothetical protein
MFWIVRWWEKRQRMADLEILWPSLKRHADHVEKAKTAFLLHTAIDPAWRDFTDEQVLRLLDGVTSPHCPLDATADQRR